VRRRVDWLDVSMAAVAAVLVAVALAGCGANATTVARKSLVIAEQVEIDGERALGEFDDVHQRAILQVDQPAASAKAQLDDYYAKRSKIRDGFRSLNAASHTAAHVCNLVDAGKAGELDVGAALGALTSAAQALSAAAQALGGFSIPGLDQLLGGAK